MRLRRLRSVHTCVLAAVAACVFAACGGGGGDQTNFQPAFGTGLTQTPVADFSASSVATTTTTPVQFTDLTLNTPTNWQWDFDNDAVVDDTSQNPAWQYFNPGTYTVTLTASNTAGNNTVTKTSYITVTGTPQPGIADMDVDTDRNGAIEQNDDATEHVWNASGGAVFYLNQDDDNHNNQHDYADNTSVGADSLDLATILLRRFFNAPSGGSATIHVNPAAQGNIRIFRKQGTTYAEVYSAGANFGIPLADLEAGNVELAIEGRGLISNNWDGRVTLLLEVRDNASALVSSDTVIMRMAPPIFATNLWTTTQYHLVNVTNFSNAALRQAMQTICTNAGITYREAPGAQYGQDRWLQDSSEPAVIQLPSATGPRRIIDNVFQCARWRPADDWCEDVLWGPNFDWFERFNTNQSSHNYGGNLEVVPPTTGKPYGTICYGGGTGVLIGTSTMVTENMVQAYQDFFDACQIQGPSFEYTSEWLAVGHIDEFSMFVPAPNTARGWVCLIASPDRAYQVLQAAPPNALVFEGRASQTTVSAILGNTALQTLNNEVQARIDQARTQIKNATGLTDADFIELPTLFEDAGGNYMVAYNPGVVNLVCMPSANGTIYLAIPDPEGPNNASNEDMFQLDINAQLANLETTATPYDITYTDVFESYHELLGETHCGSNTVRIPPNDDWWNK